MKKVFYLCAALTVSLAMLFVSCNREEPDNNGNNEVTQEIQLLPQAVTDIDGNCYDAVQIGEQVWMAENLRTTKYADGTAIPLATGGSPSPCRYAPGSGETYEENAVNVTHFGYLYNWPAVMHEDAASSDIPSGVQGICPSGWHVPSAAEWTKLTNYVSSLSQCQCDSNSVNIAKSLASNTDWESSPNHCAIGNDLNNNNATGFSALPAGGYFVGTPIEWDFVGYKHFGGGAYFWSSTLYNGEYPIHNCFSYANATVSMTSYQKSAGFSVRCIRD
jgi:uncharacterized protein (TIGR02145 family)